MILFRAFAVIVPIFLAFGAQAAESQTGGKPIVLELFTSQGCSACPPADVLFRKMSKDPSLISISWHVDYWNDLGWKDTLSHPAATARQKDYQENIKFRFVYTPQVIVNGRHEAVGSKEHKVMSALDKGHASGLPVDIDYSLLDDAVEVRVGKGQSSRPGTLWMINTLSSTDVAIGGGENNGNVFTYTNVARHVRRLGTWNGREQTFMIKPEDVTTDGTDGCAILLQQDLTGPILGAVSIKAEDVR